MPKNNNKQNKLYIHHCHKGQVIKTLFKREGEEQYGAIKNAAGD